MMQSENFPPSWPFHSFANSTIDQFEPYSLNMGVPFDVCEFSSSFTTRKDSSEISSISHFSTMFSSEIFPYPACDDQLQVTVPSEDFSVPFEGLESMLTDGIEDLYNCLDESEESFPLSQPLSSQRQYVWSPSPSIRSSEASTDMTSMRSSLNMPGEAMEIDNQLSIFHLLKAYGEATEKNQKDLAEVILKCVSEKGSPVGETWERIAFNLSQEIQNQSDYLMQESSKNFETAFWAFYQMFPYGRFAHFAANSAILEAMPNDADMLHIVDFDLGEGIQWPPMIEAMAWQHKTLRLTSIRWGEEDFACCPWRFEDTRRQLCDHARSFGLMIKVEEMGIEELKKELKKMKKRGGAREWLAFNCMVGLPHMGKAKSRKHVNEFLNAAKELLQSSDNYIIRNRGIITFGDGDACEKQKDFSGYGTFFDWQLMHYQAVLESMQSNFPKQLVQARMAMECLFVGPNICSQAWFQKWKEINESCHFQAGTRLEGLKVSTQRLMEAKEIVRGRENAYEVCIGGNCGNELTLEWRGIMLVRVSSWRN
ncbi:nodulation-signaling pathway 2 protein-like [Durio zibethinus]|uniref:Nodulation-signaling pathway 2 protein-like n=1 Tax=Durio zibethinus TaxID=66656 RepID=A0A6P6AM12_DURZI|nr:nodulation-signaling pathway 2 protein-like [Durio zibethinus]